MGTGDDGASRSGRGREATRARILDAARELFSRQGFDGTTVKDIAAMCGVTDAALYYYYRSKREILDALWTIPQSRALSIVEPGESMDFARLDNLVDVMLDGAVAQDSLLRLTNRLALAGDRTANALRDQTMAAWRQYLQGHFNTTFDRDQAGELADMLAILILGIYTDGQMEYGTNLPAVFTEQAFRDRVKALARLVIPLDELTGLEGQCAS